MTRATKFKCFITLRQDLYLEYCHSYICKPSSWPCYLTCVCTWSLSPVMSLYLSFGVELRVGRWLTLSPHRKEGPRLGPFCVELECSSCVHLGSHQVIQLPPTTQRHTSRFKLIGDSNLPIGVSMSPCGCLSDDFSPMMHWQLVLGIPCLHPLSGGICSSPSVSLCED